MIIKLRNVRLAFPALFEAKTVNGEGDPAFSATFILGADHPQLAELNAAIEEVAKAKWGAKVDATLKAIKAKDAVCLHDGNTKADYDGFPGNWFLSARNKIRPLVIDRNATALIAADGRPYAGCYVIGSVEIWAQDNNWGRRINATLRGVQFFADGDAFAAGAPATPDEFDDLTQGADAEALA